LINIVYNISRHNDGITALNSLQAIDVMKQIQNVDSLKDEDHSEKITLVLMTLTLRSTSEQMKNDRKCMNDALDHLLRCIDAAGQSEDYCRDGLHISDLLIFLMILISYERTLDYLLEHTQANFGNTIESTIQFLIKSFLKFHRNVGNEAPLKRLTMTAFSSILWSISLHQQYKQELQKNEEFKKLIKEIAEEQEKVEYLYCVPKCIENIQKAAEGILFNIKGSSTAGLRALFLVARSSSIDSNSRRRRSKAIEPNIMISYAEGDNAICTQLHSDLVKRNMQLDICIDWKYCNIDFPWEQVYYDMAEPHVILCLFSQKYYDSNLCQREFVKTFGRQNVISIRIDRTETPGWLSRGLSYC